MTLKELLDVLSPEQFFVVETPRGYNGAFQNDDWYKDHIEKLLERTKNEKVVNIYSKGKLIYITVK